MSKNREIKKLFESVNKNELPLFRKFARKNVWGAEIVDFAYRYEVLTKPHQNLKE